MRRLLDLWEDIRRGEVFLGRYVLTTTARADLSEIHYFDLGREYERDHRHSRPATAPRRADLRPVR